MDNIAVVTQDFVTVNITKSNCEAAPPVERRFNKAITVQEFKMKLEMVTGGSQLTMQLQLFDSNDRLICNIDNDEAVLGSYPIDDGMRIHVIDKFVMLNEFTGGDLTERFVLSEEEYKKKGDTVRAFLEKNKLGKYNEEEMRQIRERQEAEALEEARLASAVLVGARCEVRVPKQPCRRATVMYNGPLEGTKMAGMWIGVKYDEPLGKNDGSIEGKRYFTCGPKYGGFVKPAYITVGDFPEEEFDLDEEI